MFKKFRTYDLRSSRATRKISVRSLRATRSSTLKEYSRNELVDVFNNRKTKFVVEVSHLVRSQNFLFTNVKPIIVQLLGNFSRHLPRSHFVQNFKKVKERLISFGFRNLPLNERISTEIVKVGFCFD